MDLARFLQSFVIVAITLLGLAGTARALTTEEMLAEGSLGNEKAPVTVVEFASLTCPHCAAFANRTFDQFKAKYIDTGKVHYIYRDFPFDQIGLRAAMMARCAGPSQYFGYLAILFKDQDNWATDKDPMAALLKIARLGGMSKEDFDACMNNKALMDGILKVRLDAEQKLKVDATPTFIINGTKHEGDMPLSEFDQILGPLLGMPVANAAASTPAGPVTKLSGGAAASSEPNIFMRWWQRLKAMFQ
jgi:protein-disulfide isomerase